MKLFQFFEMTMKVKSYENLVRYLPEYEEIRKSGKHIGDIEEFQVFKKKRGDFEDYAVFQDENISAFFTMRRNILTTAYVVKDFRKKGIFSAFLLFLKRVENHSSIVIDDLQSEDTVQAIKKIHKRFDTYWVKGSEKHKYDPSIEEPYYSQTHPTGWNIVLENSGDFSDWPKFYHKTLAEATYPLAKYNYFCFLDTDD